MLRLPNPPPTQPDVSWEVVAVGLGAVTLVTVVAAIVGVVHWRRRWLIADLPTSDAAHVFVGMNELVGTTQPTRETLLAPYSAAECVWYRARLEREERSGDRRTWKRVSDMETGTPFWVVDESGRVLVRPRGAAFELPVRAKLDHTGRPESTSRTAFIHRLEEQERRLDDDHDDTGDGWLTPPPLLDGNAYRSTEWWIEPGDRLYLLGEATLRDDAVALEFAPADPVTGSVRRRLLVTTGSADQVARRSGWIALGALALTIVGAALLPPLVAQLQSALDQNPLTGQNPPVDDTTAQSIAAVALVVALFAAGYVVRLFNRLVAARERVAAAWSLIDVHVRRRHDLLPQLVAVVDAGARHEREAQAITALLRSRPPLPAAGQRPAPDALDQTLAVDRADANVARELVALAEAYPELKASQQFAALSAEITSTEDAIAFARTFYNDAVTVQRDRFGTFPGVLVRPFAGRPAGALFDAEAPERRPAEVALDPPTDAQAG